MIQSINSFHGFYLGFQMTGWLEKVMGVHGMFMSFGFICILITVIAFKFVPETSGKSYRDSVLLKKYMQAHPPHSSWMKEAPQLVAAL